MLYRNRMVDIYGQRFLFRPQGDNRIFICCLPGGDQAADKCQHHTQKNQNQSIHKRKLCVDIGVVGEGVNDLVNGEIQQDRNSHTDQAGT